MSNKHRKTNEPTYVTQLKPQHLRRLPELDRLCTLGIMAAIVFARRDTDYDPKSETDVKRLCAAAEIADSLPRLVEAKESLYAVRVDESDIDELRPEN
jgi:hypothetical protein